MPRFGQSVTPGTEGYPGQAQKEADTALLDKLNRPGWKVGDRGTPDADGHTTITLAGPDGQSDFVVVDSGDHIIVPPQKTPDKLVPATAPMRTDSPAETQTAATGKQNADTAAANATTTAAREAATTTETNRHNLAAEADTKRGQDLALAAHNATVGYQQADLAYKNNLAAIDAKYKDGQLTEQAARLEIDKAHQERQDAATEAGNANTRYREEQTAQYQQGVLANQSANTAEATRSNMANEADKSATLLQTGQRDQQASADRQAQTGATMLDSHAAQSTSMLNNWTSAAAGNKNFGLGGAIPQNMASGMFSDANNQATAAMGGQSNMDMASAMVHNANPALAKTPQGAAYTAIASQMLDQHQKDTTPQLTTGSDTAAALAPAGQAGAVSPSDPRYLGTVIAQAVQHLGGNTSGDGAARGLDSFTSPSMGITA